MGVQGPGMGVASSFPGQGGMVAMRTDKGSGPVLRNWNRAPVGISKADARTQVQDLLIVALLTPDLTFAFKHVPDFLNGAVNDSGRGLVRRQGEVVELSAAAFQQKADGRAVGGGGLRLGWEGSALHRLSRTPARDSQHGRIQGAGKDSSRC